jgi:hypothetical protein
MCENATMPNKVTFDTVRKIGLTLPGVEVSTSYGVQSLKVDGQLLACPAINKSAEPGSLVIRVDMDRRAELLEGDPATYYITDHYAAYPSVLVRLSKVNPDVLKDLLLMSWKYVTSKKSSRKRACRSR